MRRRSFLFGALSAAGGWAAREPLGAIAYVLRDGLWIRALPDGGPSRLVSGAGIDSPRFSPSGQWISYFQDHVLGVISVDGRGETTLGNADRGGAAGGALWSPAGDELLVATPLGLNVFAAGNGWRSVVRSIPGARLPVAFHPNGKEMVYADETVSARQPGGEPLRAGRLCRVALDGTDRQPAVLHSQSGSGIIPCVWSHTGEHIVFWEDASFSASLMADGLELFRIPAAGGSPRSLGVSTLVHSDMLSFVPGQDKLAVSTGGGRNEWEEKRIAVIDLATAATSYLTDHRAAAVCPAWSPGGTALAYSAAPGPAAGSSVGGGEEARRLLALRRILVADASSRNGSRPLTGDPRYRDEEPMWSADGAHILFCRMARDNSSSLWLMGAGGSDAALVAGPLRIGSGPAGADGSWFGYYGYIDWRSAFDWFRGVR